MKTNTYIKRYLKDDLIILTIIGALIIIPAKANAQDEDPESRPFQQRILNHFDKDGDGALNDREAYHARQFYKRWKESHDSVERPDVRPDRVRPDVRPDSDRVRDIRQRIDRNNDGRIGPRERGNARRIQARRNR